MNYPIEGFTGHPPPRDPTPTPTVPDLPDQYVVDEFGAAQTGSPSLTPGYTVDDAGVITGPNGGEYRPVGETDDGNTLYFDEESGNYYEFSSGRPDYVRDNNRTGYIGEKLVENELTENGWTVLKLDDVADDATLGEAVAATRGRQGIDTIAYRVDNDGKVHVLVVETKSTLGDADEEKGVGEPGTTTDDGYQGSNDWIGERIVPAIQEHMAETGETDVDGMWLDAEVVQRVVKAEVSHLEPGASIEESSATIDFFAIEDDGYGNIEVIRDQPFSILGRDYEDPFDATNEDLPTPDTEVGATDGMTTEPPSTADGDRDHAATEPDQVGGGDVAPVLFFDPEGLTHDTRAPVIGDPRLGRTNDDVDQTDSFGGDGVSPFVNGAGVSPFVNGADVSPFVNGADVPPFVNGAGVPPFVTRSADQDSDPRVTNFAFDGHEGTFTNSGLDRDQGISRETNGSAVFYESGFSAGDSMFSYGYENEHFSAGFNGPGYEFNGGTSLTFDNGTFNARADFDATVYLAQAEFEASYGPASISGEAMVGAELEGGAEIQFDPFAGDVGMEAGGSAFVGGRAETEVGVAISDNASVNGGASVSYGLGAELEADVGFEDGKFSADFDVGATLGLGVGFDVSFEVDVVETVSDVGGAIGDVGSAIGGGFKKLGGIFG